MKICNYGDANNMILVARYRFSLGTDGNKNPPRRTISSPRTEVIRGRCYFPVDSLCRPMYTGHVYGRPPRFGPRKTTSRRVPERIIIYHYYFKHEGVPTVDGDVRPRAFRAAAGKDTVRRRRPRRPRHVFLTGIL